MKTRTAPWDYARPKLPPTAAEHEAELNANGAPCPVCGLLGLVIDLLPGVGVVCDMHGVVPLELDDLNAELYDQAAEAQLCAKFGCGL